MTKFFIKFFFGPLPEPPRTRPSEDLEVEIIKIPVGWRPEGGKNSHPSAPWILKELFPWNSSTGALVHRVDDEGEDRDPVTMSCRTDSEQKE